MNNKRSSFVENYLQLFKTLPKSYGR